MKKNIWKSIGNGLLIVLAFLGISFFGLTQSFAYVDSGNQPIDIYSNGNLKVLEIAGESIEGKPMRIQSGKPYDGLVVSIGGERLELNDGFTFNNEGNRHQSLNFVYSYQDDAFYIERIFDYLYGFNAFSLVFIGVIVMNGLLLLANLGAMLDSKKKDENTFKLSFFHKMHQVLKNTIVYSLAVFGLGLMVSRFIDALFIFVYNLSDLAVIGWAVGLIISVFLVCTIASILTQNLVLTFDENRLVVTKRKHVIFDELLSKITYSDTRIRNGNTIMSKEYTKLNLELKSTQGGVDGVSLDLSDFGIDMFTEITDRLTPLPPENVWDEPSHITDTVTLRCRNAPNMRGKLIGGLVVTFIVTLVIAVLVPSMNVSMMIYAGLIVMPLILYIIFVLKLSGGKWQEVAFKVSPSFIQVDDRMIEAERIQSITLSYPTEITGLLRVLEIKTAQDTLRWEFPAYTQHKNKDSLTHQSYTSLYQLLKQTYPNMIKER